MNKHAKELEFYLNQAQNATLSANKTKQALLNCGLVETHNHFLMLVVSAYQTAELGLAALRDALRIAPISPTVLVHINDSIDAALKSQKSAIEALLRSRYVDSTLEHAGGHPDCGLVFEASHFNTHLIFLTKKIRRALVLGGYVCN